MPQHSQATVMVRVPKRDLGFVPYSFASCASFHLFADVVCPQCGSKPSRHRVERHHPAGTGAEVYCGDCGAYVGTYDRG